MKFPNFRIIQTQDTPPPLQLDGPIAWLRDMDGTGSLHACAQSDPGAFPVYEYTIAPLVELPPGWKYSPLGTMALFQADCQKWMRETFGTEIARDPLERLLRFLEEALELVQAKGLTAEECARVVEYVYARPAGDPPQEVGGVAVTLACACAEMGIDLQAEAHREFARINTPEMRRKIFDKQARKKAAGLTSDGGFRAAEQLDGKICGVNCSCPKNPKRRGGSVSAVCQAAPIVPPPEKK